MGNPDVTSKPKGHAARRWLALFAICLTAGPADLAAAARATSRLPTLFARPKCANPCDHLVGDFRVRPDKVEIPQGELNLHWTSWTATRAVARGTDNWHASSISVTVTTLRVSHDRFTLMMVHLAGASRHTVTYRLGRDASGPAWVRVGG